MLARVRIEGDVPIKQDTRARLALTGITGTSVIQLSNGSPESPRLEGTDGEDPIIVAVPSPINQFLTSGEDLLISVNELLASAQTLLSEENGRRVSHILENIDKASNTMTAQGDSLRELVEQMTLASRQATASLAQAGTLVNNANTLVTQDGARTLGSAEKAMQSLERTGATLEHLLTQNRDALTGGAQGLAELGPAIAELRTTLASLRGISRRLEDNPANYLLGRENIREFQP
ncbi:MlaD family protein [Pigmentiphaga litoralis]|uniref:MlaD family protein n=1 Tax=Pigmentiphaga litoralis TaxID=516702 RepID=UPI003B432319